MMKILYVEDDDDIREIITFRILDDTGMEVIESSCAQDALNILKSNNTINAVISDHNLGAHNGSLIYKYIQENNLNIKFVLMTGDDSQDVISLYEGLKREHVLLKPPTEESFNFVMDYVSENNNDESPLLHQDYIPFSLALLRLGTTAPEDLYIKLSETNYIHLFRKNEQIDTEDIEKYEKKSIEHFYVKNEDFRSFLKAYTVVAHKRMEESLQSMLKGNSEVQYNVHEVVHKQLQGLGISDEAIELSKKAVDSSIELVKESKDLKILLESMAGKGPWLYEHSLMLSIFSTMVINELEWVSEDTLYKVHLASFFHDLSLSNKFENQNVVESMNALTRDELKKDYKEYFDHPQEAAKHIYFIKGVPPDVNSIIALSHEKPDGSGFPKGLGPQHTFPLGCVLITTHTLLDYLYNMGFNNDALKMAYSEMDETFLIGNYEKVYLALKSAINSLDD